MMRKEDYLEQAKEHQELRTLVDQDPYRLRFHIMPPTGWLNDPNGLCEFQGINHIYFQNSPHTPLWGMKVWGHYTTTDWVHFTECEPFLYADSEEDRDGAYSGSAIVKDDEIHYFYTGNVKYVDQEYDYILQGREQNTIEIVSKDGFTYGQKRCLLKNSDYPSDMSAHVRDPKVFEAEGGWYMALGARSVEDQGCVLLYHSEDLEHWDYHMRIQSEEVFGYMWECPDLIQVDGTWFLICCPQGVEQQDVNYENVYQCGYFAVDIDFIKKDYTLHEFYELDRGFDIYAPQSFCDEEGRHILLAWMGIPDASYDNACTIPYGWQHALVMPRVLHASGDRLLQQPLAEMKDLRRTSGRCTLEDVDKQGWQMECFELQFELAGCTSFTLHLANDITLSYDDHMVRLTMEESGRGRGERRVRLQNLEHLQLFVDTSSIEIFINHGEEVFTTRCYRSDLACGVRVTSDAKGICQWYALDGYQIS